MEHAIAILIADLSGYTALTETHGAATAADVIDTYTAVVNASLVGSSRLHERVGDEVMVVSDSADALLATAVQLWEKALQQPGFLHLHGALHYGAVLFRDNSYFGITVNMASRMAAHANPGTLVCSTEFLQALTNTNGLQFKSKGMFAFKNVSDGKEILELVIDKPNIIYTDPVCRMLVNPEESRYVHPVKPGLYFCSQTCLDIYMSNEDRG
jgi:class 3 adenylate cyclase/YHS domain-containing protein